MFVRAGSISTQATSACASSRSSAGKSLNSTTRVVVVGVDRRADVAGSRAWPAVAVKNDEGLVDAAVVAPAEHEHLRTTRHVPCHPHHPAVRVRRRSANDQRGRRTAEIARRQPTRRPRWAASPSPRPPRPDAGARLPPQAPASAQPSRRCLRGRSRLFRAVEIRIRAPRAASRNTGKPPAAFSIQVIGTPPSRWVPASAQACRERGCASGEGRPLGVEQGVEPGCLDCSGGALGGRCGLCHGRVTVLFGRRAPSAGCADCRRILLPSTGIGKGIRCRCVNVTRNRLSSLRIACKSAPSDTTASEPA